MAVTKINDKLNISKSSGNDSKNSSASESHLPQKSDASVSAVGLTSIELPPSVTSVSKSTKKESVQPVKQVGYGEGNIYVNLTYNPANGNALRIDLQVDPEMTVTDFVKSFSVIAQCFTDQDETFRFDPEFELRTTVSGIHDLADPRNGNQRMKPLLNSRGIDNKFLSYIPKRKCKNNTLMCLLPSTLTPATTSSSTTAANAPRVNTLSSRRIRGSSKDTSTMLKVALIAFTLGIIATLVIPKFLTNRA